MGKFHSLHVSEIPMIKSRLKKMGFRSEEKCCFEDFRMRHAENGVVIIYICKIGDCYQKINNNGYDLLKDFLESNRLKDS